MVVGVIVIVIIILAVILYMKRDSLPIKNLLKKKEAKSSASATPQIAAPVVAEPAPQIVAPEQ